MALWIFDETIPTNNPRPQGENPHAEIIDNKVLLEIVAARGRSINDIRSFGLEALMNDGLSSAASTRLFDGVFKANLLSNIKEEDDLDLVGKQFDMIARVKRLQRLQGNMDAGYELSELELQELLSGVTQIREFANLDQLDFLNNLANALYSRTDGYLDTLLASARTAYKDNLNK